MKKKVLCTAMVATILLTQTASAAPWWLSKYRGNFDNELGITGDVTLQFASDLKVMCQQNTDTLSKDGSRIHEQSRIR